MLLLRSAFSGEHRFPSSRLPVWRAIYCPVNTCVIFGPVTEVGIVVVLENGPTFSGNIGFATATEAVVAGYFRYQLYIIIVAVLQFVISCYQAFEGILWRFVKGFFHLPVYRLPVEEAFEQESAVVNMIADTMIFFIRK